MKDTKLLNKAREARDKAYVPYSHFPVGAALKTISGKVYTGCNIENASYSLACCAERVAIFKAIAAGEKNFLAMAVIADTNRPVPPCGACRQVMSEFFPSDLPIYLSNVKGEIKMVMMEDLLPFSFQPIDLKK